VQPEFIRKALLAGKHVLSEKPIAKDIATAQELLQWYQTNIDTSKIFWSVGENFRYLTKFIFAAEQVRTLGKVLNFRVNVHNLVKADNKYYRMYFYFYFLIKDIPRITWVILILILILTTSDRNCLA
jgi:glucose-fructose oxidoreductase